MSLPAALCGDVGTDFDPFRNAGIPGVHVVYMRGSPIYHSPADNVASVVAAGADRVAVCTAVIGADDVEAAARDIYRQLPETTKEDASD